MNYRPLFRSHLHWRLRALIFASGLMLLGVVLARTHDTPTAFKGEEQPPAWAADHTAFVAGGELINLDLDLPKIPAEKADAPQENRDEGEWTEITVGNGDTLSGLFSRLKMRNHLEVVMALPEAAEALRRIHPGQRLSVRHDDNGPAEIHYNFDDIRRLEIRRTEDGFEAETVVDTPEIRIAHAAGAIESSLFLAGQRAGLSDSLIMGMAGIFGWDIDFALDIRQGDSFVLIYEEQFRDGEKLRDGAIIASEFTNRGRTYRAIRFEKPDGTTDYYDPQGRSMRKAFLRTPVEFSRISSRFGTRRHPIQHTIRQHRGVDYAAPTGTPIRASGDGRVSFRGTRGGYGKTITINHGGRYTTLYAHMSRYANSTAVGSRVRQGQVIGYVGMTGLATGPHLHYEFHVDGVHRDPLKVKLPDAEPLPQSLMADFREDSDPLLARLDLYRRIALAQR